MINDSLAVKNVQKKVYCENRCNLVFIKKTGVEMSIRDRLCT